MIQLIIAFIMAVFWAGAYALLSYFVPWFPIMMIGVVFVGAFGFSFLGLALTWAAGRSEYEQK